MVHHHSKLTYVTFKHAIIWEAGQGPDFTCNTITNKRPLNRTIMEFNQYSESQDMCLIRQTDKQTDKL